MRAGLPDPDPSLEQGLPGPGVYRTQSQGVSGGAPTALTGDTDMNGDMEEDYSSGSSEPENAEGEKEAMSSIEDSDEESETPLHSYPLWAVLAVHKPALSYCIISWSYCIISWRISEFLSTSDL